MHILIGLLKEIWHTFNEASSYILFGIFMAGLIQMFFNKEMIARHLGKPGFKSVFLAALFGVPLPLCSCGVIPTAISLRKNGASKGATLAFLISTPETGVDSISLSYALLDPLMTIYRPVSAFITAVFAGISENIFGKKETKEAPKGDHTCVFCDETDEPHSHSLIGKFKYGMSYAFVELLGDITVWLVIGISIGGAISYFVPSGFIETYLGSGLRSMLIMLLIGIPLYICASASTPIAAALIAKGMSPGVALVFLLAGPATNVAGILAVGKFLGKRSVVIYLISIAACSILLGLLLNHIYAVFGIDIKVVLGKGGEMLQHRVRFVSAVILVILMLNALRYKAKCHT